MTDFPQLRILHVSDIHFGTNHICQHENTGVSAGIPKLRDLISSDLADEEWKKFVWAGPSPNFKPTRLLLVVSGDLTHTAKPKEFDQAHDFINGLIQSPILGTKIPLGDVFVVPGNHDVVFTENEPEHRFLPYCNFYNKLFRPVHPASRAHAHPDQAGTLSQIHTFSDDRFLVAEINSSYYVEKETLDESRGQVDFQAIASLRHQLKKVAAEAKEWIKLAVVHHHPVLLPSFVEPGKGVDAILNARSLLGLLREHGFQLILHGHKHFPQVFSYDPDPAWATSKTPIPQLVVAGGAAGSKTLPAGTLRSNTYNLITLKWNPKALQARLQIVTRGLIRWSSEGELDPDQWRWQTLRVFDRTLSPYPTLPFTGPFTRVPAPKRNGDQLEIGRDQEYQRLRLNMPVVEVLPSLRPGQGYEARVWLARHRYHQESPKQVLWSAGPMFERKVSRADAAPDFCASFHYYGPMLIQAELTFEDKTEIAYVYARLPDALGDETRT